MTFRVIFSTVILFVFPMGVYAESHYRMKLSTELTNFWSSTTKPVEPDPNLQGLLNFRYLWSNSNDHWAFDLQLVSELNYEPKQQQNLWLRSVPQLGVQDRAFWVLNEGAHHSMAALIDRAQFTYKNDAFRASFGRFPNSWGRGLVFHPLDVFTRSPQHW